MKVETNMFTVVAVLLFIAAAVYGVWAREPVGAVCLVLSGALCGMIGGYLGFIARRMDARPEDRKDAEVHEGAGAVGFFSPWSYWPFGLGLAIAVATVGLAYLAWWLVAIGVVLIVLAVSGFLFEYYVGQKG